MSLWTGIPGTVRESAISFRCRSNRGGVMKEVLEWLEARQGEMLSLIELLVNIDSGSYCKEGIDRCGAIVARELEALGFETSVVPEADRGNHLRAQRPGKGEGELFLSAHLDTVFPAGTAGARPFRVEGGLAYGPGVGDIKGGIVQMLFALKALRELGRSTPPTTVFLTGDEEIGSIRGRPHIEDIARRSSWVLVMEPASEPGSVAVRRWGLGAFRLTIRGRAAHVLKPDSDGVNACRELALKILALESLSDFARGVKVSVNLVSGGRSRQVTAAEAVADIDVRVRDSSRMEEIEAMVRKVASTPILPGIVLQVEGKLTRPPLEPNPNTLKLLRLAAETAERIGMVLKPIEEYGGSDGCFTAALGVATLDGLGPRTFDMCGDGERIEIVGIVPRTALLAGIVARLCEDP
ncbi:peptidase M20 [Syntrophobacter fumaroxidans MPOB]|uniref:Peptidase M20 n=2 Tax=Syntrophobacter TaxID=29526 RepID=A0LKV4_SYNFM|nr:peptidase M20 [Syntrophobacter fumaroxidans MPOB]